MDHFHLFQLVFCKSYKLSKWNVRNKISPWNILETEADVARRERSESEGDIRLLRDLVKNKFLVFSMQTNLTDGINPVSIDKFLNGLSPRIGRERPRIMFSLNSFSSFLFSALTLAWKSNFFRNSSFIGSTLLYESLMFSCHDFHAGLFGFKSSSLSSKSIRLNLGTWTFASLKNLTLLFSFLCYVFGFECFSPVSPKTSQNCRFSYVCDGRQCVVPPPPAQKVTTFLLYSVYLRWVLGLIVRFPTAELSFSLSLSIHIYLLNSAKTPLNSNSRNLIEPEQFPDTENEKKSQQIQPKSVACEFRKENMRLLKTSCEKHLFCISGLCNFRWTLSHVFTTRQQLTYEMKVRNQDLM